MTDSSASFDASTAEGPVAVGDTAAAGSVAAAEPVAGRARGRRRRVRTVAVGLLVVLSSLLVLISTIGLWAYRQVYNTDVFVGHVDTVLSNPQVQTNLANYLTDQVMTAINPEQRAKDALPPQADALIGPVVSAIRGFVNQAALKVVSSDQFRTLVDDATRRAHNAAINLLEGKKVAGLTINGNQVVFNTLPMIDQVLNQISQQGILGNRTIPPLSTSNGEPSAQSQELAGKLGVTLPPDFGQIVVFKSDSLHSAQQALRLIKRGLLLLVVVTVVLIAVTLLLSLHRLRTLAELGIGVAIAMLVAFLVTRAVLHDVLGTVRTAASRQTLTSVLKNFLSSLRTIAILLTILGVVVALIAFVFGQSRTALWIRARFKRLIRPAEAGQPGGAITRAGAFIGAHRDGFWVIGGAVGLLILLLAGLTWPAVIVALVVVALWEAGVWYCARHAAQPAQADAGAFPPDTPAPPPPTGTAPVPATGTGT
jgi:hypothetical protein